MIDIANAHERMVSFINARDWDALRAVTHPEYAYTGPNGVQEAGGPELMVGLPMLMVDGFAAKMEIKKVHIIGDTSIAEIHATGRHVGEFADRPPTGETVEAFIVDIVEVYEGLIYREREYFDRLGIMATIGAVRPG
ncbi:MAG: ester cyclase [Dehalococcoidia bacterium]